MMTIASVLQELETAERPVAKALHKSDTSKAICIGFNKGMQLKEHKANKPTTLLVLSGCIKYQEDDKTLMLNQFEQYAIPVEVLHAVEAQEDSLILLCQ